MTSRMWACLRSVTSLKRLTISKSSFSIPSSSPELPSVTNLSDVRVTSNSYEGLISLLPGVENIDITIDDAEGDMAHITAGLRRTGGQKLKHIHLYGPSSLSPGSHVSEETMRGLGLIIKEHTQNLLELHLQSVKCRDEDDLVYLMECCRHVKTLQYVLLSKCGTTNNGRLHSYLGDQNRGSSDGFYVRFEHVRYTALLLRFVISMSH
ncbi:uncharacterized protein LOC135154392 [Lytechinus pictus]|uniref:uncharacterized protein LOC135154392 n=1 Tax=Lytechinus pictus TaxID=7653 RepID=UPI0030B9E1B1